ncbi:hypothetical protein LUZ61_005653 [Rhynchospora tenuis]|uniref:3'-5' exonuclease domain-containing protein n=1 Tax=Rhynchospora tenuis TaxID=198213 RepID=A0AAD5ZQ32_9POAL|nr:hypothetical protein LUZ61_005653 [Rhynchospora tenuis]
MWLLRMNKISSRIHEPSNRSELMRTIFYLLGGSISYNGDKLPSVPIYIVTKRSQLPVEFLAPSPGDKLVIGLDCEGVNLSRNGTLCIMQLAFANAIFLVDAIEGGAPIMEACKPALESNFVTKVIHDCKRDSEALYFQFGIKLNNVMDTQIAYNIIEEQEGKKQVENCMSFVGLLADPRYCGVSYHEKDEVRALLRQDPSFWTRRPLSEIMIRSATDDVKFLLYIYQKMIDKLSKQSLWRVLHRGVLYCQCYCLQYSNADWSPSPPIPFPVGVSVPVREVLSILNIPLGRMGCVIGKRGSFIRFVEQSSNAKIFTGRSGCPDDRVFIIGLPGEVRNAKALIESKLRE